MTECAWCGAPCSPTGPSSRAGERFCSKAHRDASSRALRRLRESEAPEVPTGKAARHYKATIEARVRIKSDRPIHEVETLAYEAARSQVAEIHGAEAGDAIVECRVVKDGVRYTATIKIELHVETNEGSSNRSLRVASSSVSDAGHAVHKRIPGAMDGGYVETFVMQEVR